MPIQPTQADLDDYARRQALAEAGKPVLWGPNLNAYSYERHVREEQEAQRRRAIEFRRQQDEKRALAQRQQQQRQPQLRQPGQPAPMGVTERASRDREAALIERLSLPAPARPGTTPQEEADYQARQETTRKGDPIVWGPQTPDYARHVQDEQNAQRKREIVFAQQQRAKREGLRQPPPPRQMPPPSSGQLSVPPGSQNSRVVKRDNRPFLEPYVGAVWDFFDPPEPVVPPIPMAPALEQPKQQQRPPVPRPAQPQQQAPTPRPAQQPVSAWTNQQLDQAFDAAGSMPLDKLRALRREVDSLQGNDDPVREQKLRELQNVLRLFDEATSDAAQQQPGQTRRQRRQARRQGQPGQTRRERRQGQLPQVAPQLPPSPLPVTYLGQTREEIEREVEERFANTPVPPKTPDEKAYDNWLDMRTKLMGRNVDQLTRTADPKTGLTSPLTPEEQKRVTEDRQKKGPVDELSNLSGRLAGLRGANDRARAKEEAENAEHIKAVRRMHQMRDERAAEEGISSALRTPISSRRVEGTDDGRGNQQTAAGMRRKAVRDREAARKENVNRARTAARTGEKFKQKLTGNDEIDRYVAGAVASIQDTTTRKQDEMRQRLMGADVAAEGKLGYIKGIQAKEAADAALRNKLVGERKAANRTRKQQERTRRQTLEDAKAGRKRAKKDRDEEREYNEGVTNRANELTDARQKTQNQFLLDLEGIKQGGGVNYDLTMKLMNKAQADRDAGIITQEEFEAIQVEGNNILRSGPSGFSTGGPPSAPLTHEQRRDQAKKKAAKDEAIAAGTATASANRLHLAIISQAMSREDALAEAENHGPQTLALLQARIKETEARDPNVERSIQDGIAMENYY